MPDTEKKLYIAAILLAVMMFCTGMSVLFGGDVEQLPLRQQPVAPPPEETVTREMRFRPEYFASLLTEDAKKYGVSAPTPAAFARPLKHFAEFSGRQRLGAKRDGGFETEHLKIALAITKEWAQAPGGGFTTEHAVLKVTNKTDKYLAYRVVTDPSDARRCLNKAEITHNAIALSPGEEIARTECAIDSTTTITVTRVEVIELSPLSYHYLCRLRPNVLLLDDRTSAGHSAGRGQPCPPIAWADIKAGAEAKEVEWRDVADFYARHSCDEYTFARGYKFRDKEGPLPVKPGSR
ncbi:MAG TPA: hypothetical protein VGQ83_25815 [Polyangia bacterium]|jgi:hypothetical protein